MFKKKINGPVVLLIMDGVGSYRPYKGNAVAYAETPNLEQLWRTYPTALLHASSRYVGLPEGIKGNSEVGHMNLSAGKIVLQDLPRINKSILDKKFFTNKVLKDLVKEASLNSRTTIHLMGAMSDGEVHSTIEHLKALLLFFKLYEFDTSRIRIHAFTDGRDAPPKSAFSYFFNVDNFMREYRIQAKFSTIIGRRFAMDRNRQWDYTKQAYDLLTQFKGQRASDWGKALENAYRQVDSDEFIPPIVLDFPGNKPIQKGDVILAFNYRADRMIQLMDAFVMEDFDHFPRVLEPKDVSVYSLNYYGRRFAGKIHHVFPKIMVGDNIGKIISDYGLKQLRIAESVKFPHITYFFNGGMNVVYPFEDRIKIPTDHRLSFDANPKMQVYKITDALIENLQKGEYDFYVVNFANGDMVGHTGNIKAAKEAMHHIDVCVKKAVDAVLKANGVLLITADHGNVEEMLDPITGAVDTEHSIYPVPFIAVGKDYAFRPPIIGKLSDVSLTVLNILGIPIPGTYDGQVLV